MPSRAREFARRTRVLAQRCLQDPRRPCVVLDVKPEVDFPHLPSAILAEYPGSASTRNRPTYMVRARGAYRIDRRFVPIASRRCGREMHDCRRVLLPEHRETIRSCSLAAKGTTPCQCATQREEITPCRRGMRQQFSDTLLWGCGNIGLASMKPSAREDGKRSGNAGYQLTVSVTQCTNSIWAQAPAVSPVGWTRIWPHVWTRSCTWT